MSDNHKLLHSYLTMINERLSEYIPDDGSELSQAMRYSLLCGGKRVRPVITLAFCRMCGKEESVALPFACAIEMVHTYSLIFDDLPSMDNDDYRRGQLANHKVFGDAMAMLAGLGLYAKAFEIVTDVGDISEIPASTLLRASNSLARASGLDGIIPGQAFDIKNNGTKKLSYDNILNIHKLKTSAMLEISASLGCLAAGAEENVVLKAKEYAEKIGLAFQIRDDILDVIGSEEKMGKTIGKDREESKTTFVDVFGVEKSQSYVRKYSEEAIQILSYFDNNDFLVWFTGLLCDREN